MQTQSPRRRALNRFYFPFIMLSLVFRRNRLESVVIRINNDCFTQREKMGFSFVHKFRTSGEENKAERKTFGFNKNPLLATWDFSLCRDFPLDLLFFSLWMITKEGIVISRINYWDIFHVKVFFARVRGLIFLLHFFIQAQSYLVSIGSHLKIRSSSLARI